MPEKLFIDGDDVLFMSVPGEPLKKFKVVSAVWDKTNNEWIYKISNKSGESFVKVREKLLTMD
ncbi:MAG: hypothetical protein H7281_08555 [Bacteriovorax sp.]|nr:hypothetical protein [Bacteriovorax sp.]